MGFNIDRFTKALSDILSEKHGVTITIKAERKKENDRKQEVILCRDSCKCAI